MNKYNFPKDFLWGASVSAHQVEGNNNNQWTNWERSRTLTNTKTALHELRFLKKFDQIVDRIIDPENYISGKLADHYNNYAQDFSYLQAMNMNAFRFSIEWSRIEPSMGEWDGDAVNYYRNYICELKNRGIEPILTLFHFTLPVWFADMGGFEKRSNVNYFIQFAKRIVQEVGADLNYIITINEPEAYVFQGYFNKNWPPGVRSFRKSWKVINNLAFAHIQLEQKLHKINSKYQLSIAKNSVYFHKDGNAVKNLVSFLLQYFQDDFFIKRVVRHCDFLGVNFYFSSNFYGHWSKDQSKRVNDLNWDMKPGEIEFVLKRLYRRYKIPIIVTENGLADSSDSQRKWWISQTLAAMQRAIEKGVDLKGYLHWSLIDNFEWSFGKWPRFGLVEINYDTGERKLRNSAKWFAGVLKKIRKSS